MALSNYEAIKQEVLDNLTELESLQYPEDRLHEMAGNFCPVYNSEIISEWCELPWEDTDVWKEMGFDTQKNEGGIIKLMSLDLYFYYSKMFHMAWESINDDAKN